MRIGVIGLGSIGERHVRNIRVCYPRATVEVLTKRKNVRGLGAQVRRTSSEKDFFKNPHDVYFITNETYKHAPTLKRCLLQNPRGIFVEKPLSHSVKSLTRVRSLLARKKTILFVGYNFQFFKPLEELKKLIRKKAIGDVVSMRVSAGQDLRTWRKRDYRGEYSSNKHKGGGVVLDLIHELNYPAWLLDHTLEYITGYTGKISNLKINTEDFAEGIFRSTHGVIVSAHLDYIQSPGHRHCEIIGTKGTLVWDMLLSDRTSTIRLLTPRRVRTRRISIDRNEMYKRELRAFMHHVRANDGFSNLAEALRDVHNAEMLKDSKKYG